ncbi:hypothetical protein EP7_000844 [Isosphaeraceae bacterium EP7]
MARFVALALLAGGGCSAGDGLAREAVSGMVTLDGKPMARGTIQFIPRGGDSRGAAWGQIVAGAYSIPASDGPAAGDYGVSITPEEAVEPAGQVDQAPGEPTPRQAGLATGTVYTPISALGATIASGHANRFDFGLSKARSPRLRGR